MTEAGPTAFDRSRFLEHLRRHLRGLREKATGDFSSETLDLELKQLRSDPVYSAFRLDTEEYAAIRLLGRMSISIGRRLGDLYERLPRIAAQTRFGLTDEQVSPKLGGRLELDVCIPVSLLSKPDRDSVAQLFATVFTGEDLGEGLAIEIRYNFNPNDSSRLRKDCEMTTLIRAQKMFPIYMVFSTSSPRGEAIKRLKKAGWHFLIGIEAYKFLDSVFGFDVFAILAAPDVRDEVHDQIRGLMSDIFSSEVMKKIGEKQSESSGGL